MHTAGFAGRAGLPATHDAPRAQMHGGASSTGRGLGDGQGGQTVNPTCACGDVLRQERPEDLMWLYPPQSLDTRRLFMLATDGIGWVWACDCGFWMPGAALEGNRSAARRA